MSDSHATHSPKSGLWAYHRGQFLVFYLEEQHKKMDHVTWFRDLGLPDFGLDFDRILRGRMMWNPDEGHYTLSFYDAMQLPNIVYEKVVRSFSATEIQVIEKPVQTDWNQAF